MPAYNLWLDSIYFFSIIPLFFHGDTVKRISNIATELLTLGHQPNQHAATVPMSLATSELLSDLFMPPATQLDPLTTVSVNKHHGRSGSRAQQVQACSAVVQKQASERLETLCVILELPEGSQSGPLFCLPRCLPPFIFQS